MPLLDALLLAVGAFGFGWGLAERSNREALRRLWERVDRLLERVKEGG